MSFEQERERLVRDIAVVCFESVLSLSFERASDVLIFVLSTNRALRLQHSS